MDRGLAVMEVIARHIAERLRQSAVDANPFPHFFVTDLLPSDFYAELIRHRPTPAQYLDCGKRHHVNGKSSRTHFPLLDGYLSEWDTPDAELWRMLRDALCSYEVKEALFHCLRDGLAYRFGVHLEEAERLAGYPSPTLYRETQGYAIAPHPDTRKKMITMQLALPDDERQRDLGTALYRRSMFQVTRSPRGFVKVKQFPFIPNSAYAFVVLNSFGRKSWHGREELSAEHGIRHTLLNIYGESPNEFPAPEAPAQQNAAPLNSSQAGIVGSLRHSPRG